MARKIHYYHMHINILVTITNTLSICNENIYKSLRERGDYQYNINAEGQTRIKLSERFTYS